jgi:phosphoglycolate phosphatase
MILIFDFDGTLYDSFAEVWRALLRQQELVPQLQRIKTKKDLLKIYEGNFYEQVCRLNRIPVALAPVLNKRMQACFPADYRPRLHEGVKSVLQALAKANDGQNKLIVVSSNYTGPMMHLLRRDKIHKKFAVVSGADHGHSKTQRVADLLRWLNALPSDAYYITDTVGDIKEMRPLGLKTVGVSWGFHSATQLKKAGAALIVKVPADLLRLTSSAATKARKH